MRTLFRLLFVLCLLTFKLQAQTYPCDVGPQIIQAHSLIASNSIYLVWPANVYRLELTVSRRAFVRDAHAWNDWVQLTSITDTNISQLAGSYKDTGVSSGVHYEYKIMSRVPPYDCNDNSITQYGYRRYQYISAGWDLPVQDSRGNVVLLVESGIATPLAEKLTRLQNDLIGDGYKVIRHDVAAVDVTAGTSWTNAVWSTRNLVKADYASDTTATWYLFIVGHVPVPYSGLSSPGSHTENFGAHPSDWFYAEMNDSAWTDTTANDTTATDSPTNWNIPNDGKLDQRFVPEIPEFRVGRVDFRNMPAFGKSETELLAQYLNRNHAWRTKGYTVRSRGLIIPSGNPMEMIDVASSQFGTTTNIDSSLWRSTATNSFKSYLFSESNSSGGYDHDNTLGFTSDFAATHLYVAFPSSFGSYYGDWDSAIHPDIFSWSALASEGYAVAWYYHENGMNLNTSSMDEPIGNELYSIAANWWRSPASRYLNYTRIVSGSEFDISEQMQAYVSLLGDPTLRWNQISPPKYVSASVNGSDKVIKWEASPESSIEGYHVYRAPSSDLNSFTRLTSSPTTLLTYTDTGAGAGSYRYMVRTVKKVVTTGRSFYTMSEGILSLRGRHVEKTGNDTTGDGSMSAPYD